MTKLSLQITNVFVNGHSNPKVKVIGLKMSPILEHIKVPELQVPLHYSSVPPSTWSTIGNYQVRLYSRLLAKTGCKYKFKILFPPLILGSNCLVHVSPFKWTSFVILLKNDIFSCHFNGVEVAEKCLVI